MANCFLQATKNAELTSDIQSSKTLPQGKKVPTHINTRSQNLNANSSIHKSYSRPQHANIFEGSDEDFVEDLSVMQTNEVNLLHKHCISVLKSEDFFDDEDIS